MLPDHENVVLAVEISLLSCIQAEIHVIFQVAAAYAAQRTHGFEVAAPLFPVLYCCLSLISLSCCIYADVAMAAVFFALYPPRCHCPK